MPYVIERNGTHMTPRGWRNPGADAGAKYPTQGEAQEAMDELMSSGLAALGGKVQVKEVGP